MTKTDMQIRPIKTKQDHRAAVARIEALMSALPDTPEGDEFEVLATLVDAYEAKHYVIDAPDPVSAIQFRMEQQQLSRKDFQPFVRLAIDCLREAPQSVDPSTDFLLESTCHRRNRKRGESASDLRSR